jgi:hypothetical protein
MDAPATETTLRSQEKLGTERPNGLPAFKEWAIVCASIERGETSLIFRKGGIAEGRNGFEFKHRRFFLFPTFFHEQIERTRLGRDSDLAPRTDNVTLSAFVDVEFAPLVRDLSLVQSLEAFHVLQPSVLEERFHYDDEDGLYVAFLRAFRVSPVWELPFRPAFAGCRSWITLPDAPADLKMEPVLGDEEQARRRSICASRLGLA